MKQWILLGFIIILALVLRVVNLGETPSFHSDEVDFTYNAYSLLLTGKDQSGKLLPLATTSVGDFRPAAYTYFAILPVKLLGATEFAGRLPSATLGSVSVLILYLLAKVLLKSKRAGFISAVLLTFSFWHINLSREASEKVMAMFFVLFGLLFVYHYVIKARLTNLFLAFIFLMLSIHSYYSPRPFLLLLLPVVYLLYRKVLMGKQKLVLAAAVGLFMLAILYFTFFFGQSSERIGQLNIFNHPYTVALLGEQIREEGNTTNVYATRFYHNKLVNFGFTIGQNYLDYFSPRYLFLQGGFPNRVKIPAVGLLNLAELPLLAYGIFALAQRYYKDRNKEILLVFFWLVLAPLSPALTYDEIPNVYRTLLMLPPLLMVIAAGVSELIQMLVSVRWGKVIITGVAIFYCWNLLFFVHQYHTHFEIHQSQYRNYAQKELGLLLKEIEGEYDTIYISKGYSGADQVIRYYFGYNPEQYQAEGSPRDEDYEGFGKIVYVPTSCGYPELIGKKIPQVGKNYLYINRADCQREYEQYRIATITWRDNSPAYRVISPGVLSEHSALDKTQMMEDVKKEAE